MGMVSRDWICLNGRCGHVFHSYEPAPACPACGNIRVDWIPGGGHIGKVAPRMDRTLRTLADDFGRTNFNSPSPSRLNRAAERANHPHPSTAWGQKTFGAGFHSNVYREKAACEVVPAPAHPPVRPIVGSPFTAIPADKRPSFAQETVVHAAHRPQGVIQR